MPHQRASAFADIYGLGILQIGRNSDAPVPATRQIPPTPTSPEPPVEVATDNNPSRDAEGDIAEAAEKDEVKGLVTPKRLDILSATRASDRSPVRLMSPPITRKTPSPESLELKQAKAQELRESLLQDKAEKLKAKAEKFRAVRERADQSKIEQLKSLKDSLEDKQARAEKKREMHLRAIQDRAKDEEKKVDEISFIQNFSVESKRMDSRQRFRDFALRLTHLELERLRKSGESAAMQEAATERRRLQEAARAERVKRDEERMREAEMKRENERREREKEWREKEEEKARRLEALKSLRLAEEEEMRRELEIKLLKSSQRKDEQMRAVKEKAALANQNAKMVASRVHAARGSVASTPDRNSPMPGVAESVCLSCSVEVLPGDGHVHEKIDIVSRASPIPGKRGMGDIVPGVSVTFDKTAKNRLKKIRKNMKSASEDFQYISIAPVTKVSGALKIVKQKLTKLTPLLATVANERTEPEELTFRLQAVLNEAEPILETGEDSTLVDGCLSLIISGDVQAMLLGALGAVDGDGWPVLSASNVQLACSILYASLNRPTALSHFLLHPSLYLLELINALVRFLPLCSPAADEWLKATAVLMKLIVSGFRSGVADVKGLGVQRMREESIQYLVLIGIIDRLREIMRVVHGPIPEGSPLLSFLVHGIQILEVSTDIYANEANERPIYTPSTSTPLKSLLRNSFRGDLVGLVTMLDAIIFCKGMVEKVGEEEVDALIVDLGLGVVRVLNNVCAMDLGMVQSILMGEGMQSEFFHLCTFWVKYWFARSPNSLSAIGRVGGLRDGELCSLDKLLEELILLLGYMCIDERRGREMMRFGTGPVLLKLLCGLPFGWFLDERLQSILLPSLIVATYNDEDNRQVVREEVSFDYLTRFAKGSGLGFLKDVEDGS
ncbi:hypothetical protein HK097_010396 [Rhizophlyctis rosea]|uniref:S phase cyclin A-associated protein in the endoplasmic reticulum N-terminal domain-containing protein n=1 Tax=Rhizophlyctis rosea TaxID=64517 RepID=A0AAD5WZT1_9FUNG|nr:hypothetical protein HK097_010396 [Rhizophlyctis rosea]